MRMPATHVLLGSMLTLVLQACTSAPRSTAEALRGQALYGEQCAVCHGAEGGGDGGAAEFLFPKPRDFTRAYYKIRSTESGSLPTDEDLYETITRGMPGSAMPSFEWIPETERRALVEVVKSFSQDFATLEPQPLPEPPLSPPADARAVRRGAAKYGELGCGKCHGSDGRGDGPSAAGLTDDWGYPIRPNDFTRGIYKGGGTERDIYVRFVAGMDGTPMPSYAGTATPDEIWALVHYVTSLGGDRIAVQPSSGRLYARRIAEPVPEDPTDPRWDAVGLFAVPLMLLWQRQDAIDVVRVRAVHDGERVAILMSWEDATAAWSVLRGEEFADAVAVQFSLVTPPPHFSMGSGAGRVNVWHWRADRQLDLARRRDLSSVYPAGAADTFPGGPRFNTAADAANLGAAPALQSAVQDLVAQGFGTLTARPASAQDVAGTGVWDSGIWRVVVHRTLRAKDKGGVSFAVGGVAPIALAVWNGDRGDRDGQKAVSTWYELEIER